MSSCILPARDRSQLYQVKNRKQSKLVKGRGRRREYILSLFNEVRINRSRIRDPYVRFCERDGVSMISSPHPTRFRACVPIYCGLTFNKKNHVHAILLK